MKKFLSLFLPSLMTMVVLFSACDKKKAEPTNPGEETEYTITVAEERVELMVGDIYTISATVTPEPDCPIEWTYKLEEDGEKIIALSESGQIKALAEGETYVRVSAYLAEEDYLLKRSVKVIVSNNKVLLKDWESNEHTITDTTLLMEGLTKSFSATLKFPQTITNVSWQSSNTSIAAVNPRSVGTCDVTAGKTEGVAKITATIETENGMTFSSSTFIKVRTNLQILDVKTDEVVTNKTVEIKWYEPFALTVPKSYRTSDVTWTISDTNVAEQAVAQVVPYNFTIKGLAVLDRTTTITVTVGDQTASFKVKPVPNTEFSLVQSSLTLDPASIAYFAQRRLAVAWTLKDEDADAKKITWTSSNPSAVSLSATTGWEVFAKAIAYSSTPVTITAKYLTYSSTCTVTIYPITTPLISIFGDKYTPDGETLYRSFSKCKDATTLSFWQHGSELKSSLVTWTSVNTNVATISGNTLTVIKPGILKIRANIKGAGYYSLTMQITND